MNFLKSKCKKTNHNRTNLIYIKLQGKKHSSCKHYSSYIINPKSITAAKLTPSAGFNYLAKGSSYQIFDWISIQFHILVVRAHTTKMREEHGQPNIIMMICSYHLSQSLDIFSSITCVPGMQSRN